LGTRMAPEVTVALNVPPCWRRINPPWTEHVGTGADPWLGQRTLLVTARIPGAAVLWIDIRLIRGRHHERRVRRRSCRAGHVEREVARLGAMSRTSASCGGADDGDAAACLAEEL
jgi:hypothetical protein